MAQRGRKGLAKNPLFKPRASSDPTRAISSRHHPAVYETANGTFTRAQWRKLTAYQQFWMRRSKALWPPDMFEGTPS
jgi:hypothetical protein